MPKFKYKALKDNSTFIDGEIDASDHREAREKIRLLGYIPTKVYSEELQEEISAQKKQIDGRNVFFSLSEKIAFTRDIQIMISSGIPILDALHNVEVNTHDLKLKKVASDIGRMIESGHTFAQSLETGFSKTFGNVYIALVKAGEDAGELDVALERMLGLLRKQDDMKSKIVNASIYPCVLLIMMFGLLVLFSKFVFPSIAGVMLANGTDIPLFAQTVMGGMSFISDFWWVLLMAVAAFGYAVVFLYQNTGLKRFLDKFVLRIPVISEFVEFISLSNFVAALQVAYDAGIPIITGLNIANRTVGNSIIKEKVENSAKFIKKGYTLSESLQWTKAIPNTILSMISAGEKSGTLGKMLKDASNVIDKKVDMILNTIARLFEPTIIIILGIFILIIAVAFLQIYNGMLGTLF